MSPLSHASLATKLSYGSGAAAFGIKDTGFNYFLLIYYNQVLGLEPFLAGTALALSVAIDAMSDLGAGYVSDQWRSAWGRRHPFMYASVVPVVLTFVLLWNPPRFVLADQATLFTYLLVMAIGVRSCITFFEIPNAAQGPELTQDYDDRTRLMGFRYLFGWLGGLTLSVLTYVVLFPLDPAQQMGPTGYEWFGVIGAATMFLAMMSSSLGTHRYIPTFYKPEKRDDHSVGRVIGQFRDLFRNRSFVSVFTSSLFFGAAAGLSQALSIYLGTYFWQLKSTELGMIPMLGLAAVPVAFMLAPRLSEGMGKKRAAMTVYLFAIAFLPIAYIAQLAGVFPARESAVFLPLLMANYAIETTAIITMQIIFASMNADLVEDHSAETTGERNEGLIFAARNFAKKAVSGMGVMLAGAILWSVGFPDGVAPGGVDASIVSRLVLVYLPVLVALFAASWAALGAYGIDRGKHEANLRAAASEPDRG